jgi:glycosyltransferase involved in cell wall biosynthesis
VNILHVSNTDVAGGRFTGYYMQRSLDKSFNVEMAVWKKTSQSAHVHQIPPRHPLLRFVASGIMSVGDRAGLDGIQGSGGWMLPTREYFKRADVVHLHLIHGNANLSILSLPRLSRLKPVVWTIHDSWALTGGSEHPFECDRWLSGCQARCPHPRRTALFKHYTPYLHWRIKKRVYERSDIALVVASRWMEDRVHRSPLLNHLPCERIPFGVDLSVFKPSAKNECREKLGIPAGWRVIAFRDAGLASDRFKGMRWLMEALTAYEPAEPTCLLILQNGKGFEGLSPKYRVVTPGWLDGEDLAAALAAADVFVMPSVQEAFGLMAVEAMACGTPVVVFDGTALPDVIRAPLGGLSVPALDSGALMAAITRVLEDDELRSQLCVQARQLAEREYSAGLYVQRHIRLYENVIERHQRANQAINPDNHTALSK